jgi:hypothetical protein
MGFTSHQDTSPDQWIDDGLLLDRIGMNAERLDRYGLKRLDRCGEGINLLLIDCLLSLR